jgi:hypothetical protein
MRDQMGANLVERVVSLKLGCFSIAVGCQGFIRFAGDNGDLQLRCRDQSDHLVTGFDRQVVDVVSGHFSECFGGRTRNVDGPGKWVHMAGERWHLAHRFSPKLQA